MPSVFNPAIMGGVASGKQSAVTFPGSLLFDGSTGTLTQAYATGATSEVSVWVKFSTDATATTVLNGIITHNANGTISVPGLTTTAVFRDLTAWYHIYLGDNLYINGVDYGAATHTSITNAAWGNTAGSFYLAEGDILDNGARLSHNSFGRDDGNGTWVPLRYTRAFGTAGSKIAPQDGSTLLTGAVVHDYSGNGNDFTLTGGVTAEADGPGANISVLNELDSAETGHFSNGNRTVATPANDGRGDYRSTLSIPKTGRYYYEVVYDGNANDAHGVYDAELPVFLPGSLGIFTIRQNGDIRVNGAVVTTVGAATTGDVDAIDLDMDALTATAYRNGALLTGPHAFVDTGFPFFAGINDGSTGIGKEHTYRFAEAEWEYTSPGGVALQASNFPAPLVADPTTIQGALTFTSTGAAINVPVLNSQGGAVSLATDGALIVVKRTDANGNYYCCDTVVGANTHWDLKTAGTATLDANLCVAINDGSVDFGTSLPAGTYTLQYHKVTPGVFDIVNAVNNATTAHGLGAPPDFAIMGSSVATATTKYCYHRAGMPQGDTIRLDAINNQATSNAFGTAGQAPTAADVTIGNIGGDVPIYLWASSLGLTAFPAYTGNNSADGPFLNVGFSPAIFYRMSLVNSRDHYLSYAIRDAGNPNDAHYEPNNNLGTDREITGYSDYDNLAVGVKFRDGSSGQNDPNDYIAALWALHPTGPTPATAR